MKTLKKKKDNKKPNNRLLRVEKMKPNTKQNGVGVIVYKNPEGNKRVYTGEIKNGKPNGKGTDDFVDEGNKYEGEFRNGYANGLGRWTWSDGSMYEGQVTDGMKHGEGTYTHPEGTRHEGEWGNDNPIRIKEYKNGKITGKHFFLKNGGSSSIDDKFLTMSEYTKKNPKNKSLNN